MVKRASTLYAGSSIATRAAIPGIPGVLLNEGMISGKDVIVLLVSSESDTPDLKATYNLCDSLSKLVPGISCNLSLLEKQARQIEKEMKQVETERKDLSNAMYR